MSLLKKYALADDMKAMQLLVLMTFMQTSLRQTQAENYLSKKKFFNIRKNIFACLFSVHIKIRLLPYEKVCII